MSVGSLSLKQGRTEGVGASFAAEFGKRGLDFLIGRDFPTRHLCAGLVDRRQFLSRGVVDATRVQFLDTVENSSTSSSRSSGSEATRSIRLFRLVVMLAIYRTQRLGGQSESVPARWALRRWPRSPGHAFCFVHTTPSSSCPASRPGGRRRTRCSAPCGRCRLRSRGRRACRPGSPYPTSRAMGR